MLNNKGQMSNKGIIIAVIGVVLLIIALSMSSRLLENVPADQIVIIQDPVDGDLHFHTEQGLKYQNFGTTTSYNKRFQYWFTAKSDQGEDFDQSIRMRFNDGGHANVSGSCSIELPLTKADLEELHIKYGSDEAIINELIRPTLEKAIYMTGPLMSSKESYADKRNIMISYIEDQATKGVYRTISREAKIIDQMTGTEKIATVVEPVRDPVTDEIIRSEESPLARFNVKVYNLSINEIKYDDNVEKQINVQQQAIMDVQTAIAEAKKAEQDAIKAEQEGIALAATAKWEREVDKAKAVVAAQERLEVATLDNQTAEQRKQENIKLGEGEAQRKQLVMAADGALEKKLATYKEVMTVAFQEIGKQKWVPDTQINSGGNGVKSGGPMMDLVTMVNTKILRDLSLDMSVPNK